MLLAGRRFVRLVGRIQHFVQRGFEAAIRFGFIVLV